MINRNANLETNYFNSIWEPYYERHGRINRFIAVAHEVTGQVLNRNKLEEIEHQIRSLVESALPIEGYLNKLFTEQMVQELLLTHFQG